jgi:hypothetical protein
MRISITELTPSGLTRKRGHEAVAALDGKLKDDATDITIELDAAEFISVSFMDEFVQGVSEAGLLDRITFATERDDHLNRLRRVSDVQDVELFRETRGEREAVQRKPAPKLIAVPDPDDSMPEL